MIKTTVIIGCVLLLGIIFVGRDGPKQKPLSPDIRADHIVVLKAQHEMLLYSQDEVIRKYTVALGRGGLQPKTREGDNRVPEGKYRIIGRNPNSAFHLSLRLSYPEKRDLEAAAARNESPGCDIMIHGLRNGLGWIGSYHTLFDWTAGCVAVTNAEIEEIWHLVPDGTSIEIYK